MSSKQLVRKAPLVVRNDTSGTPDVMSGMPLATPIRTSCYSPVYLPTKRITPEEASLMT